MSKRWTEKSGFQWERAGEGFSNTWLTPPELVEALGKFDLDPCAAGADFLSHCCHAMPKGDSYPSVHSRCAKCGNIASFSIHTYKRPWNLARRNWTMRDGDSLQRDWPASWRAFVNMPYGRNVGKWLSKCCEHGNNIVLTYARTSTTWFRRYVWREADAVLFLDHRLSFYTPAGSLSSGKPAANVLVAFGPENVEALRECGISGALIENKNMRIINGRKIN